MHTLGHQRVADAHAQPARSACQPVGAQSRRPPPVGRRADLLADPATMSDAQIRSAREHLGLSAEALAALLGVANRSVRRWEAGTHPIPPWGRAQVQALQREAAVAVEAIVAGASQARACGAALVTYRGDADYWSAHPGQRAYPASWHRAITARAAHAMPSATVTYLA